MRFMWPPRLHFGPDWFTPVLALLIAAWPVSTSVASAQQLLVFPKQQHVGGVGWDPTPLREACLNPQSWPTGWERAEMFGNSFQFFEAWASDAEIAQCFTNLRNAGKKLVVELGALKPDCQTAQACWNRAQPTLLRLAALNPPDAYLAIDEPITTGHPNFPHQDADFNYAVAQTVEFIRIARSWAPGLKFILHEAYPHLSATTVAQFYTAVHYGAINQTGMGIQFASLDWDWNAPQGTLWEIDLIQDYVRDSGMLFSILCWNAQPHLRSWEDGLMHQGWMIKNFGLQPDMLSILNFINQPVQNIPEWTPSTFMRSVRNFSNTFLPRPTASHGLRPGDYLYPNQSRTSVDGRFRLVYQGDGNLVLYFGATPLWHTHTYGSSTGFVAMQSDGNLVIYNGSGAPIWTSGTSGNAGAYLVVQSDGNLVIYHGANPLVASNTAWY